MQTWYFHIVDKYPIPRVIVYAVRAAIVHNTGVNARDNYVLYCTVRTDCVVHLTKATTDHCYWPIQAATAHNKLPDNHINLYLYFIWLAVKLHTDRVGHSGIHKSNVKSFMYVKQSDTSEMISLDYCRERQSY